MQSLRAYFESEREYLKDVGKEFARDYPKLAYMLRGEGSDPSVERLLQGVAFLTGRIRRRLDDELPELSHGLMQLLWPHYLRPTPSMAIQHFRLPSGETRPAIVPRGSELRSIPIRAEEDAPAIPVAFRTVYDTVVPPFSVAEARVDSQGRHSCLRLRLRLPSGVTLGQLDFSLLQSLRFHLHGDGRAPSELLYFILHRSHPERPCRIRSNRDASAILPLPPAVPVGLSRNQALLPGWDRSLDGYRILQEYFVFPEKFLFFDVQGLRGLSGFAKDEEFWIEFPFDGAFPHDVSIKPELFKLGCTPVVNLQLRSASPLRRRPHRAEYRLNPTSNEYRQYEVFSVDEVVGQVAGSTSRRVYRPFFERASSRTGTGPGSRWYQVQLRQSERGRGLTTYLSFSLPENVERDEKFSVMLTCTNGRLAAELRAGDIRQASSGVPYGLKIENLRAPTLRVPPPLGRELEWRLIAHLGLSRQSLASREAMTRLLTLYNFPAAQSEAAADVHFKRMAALQDVQVRPVDLLVSLSALSGAEDLEKDGQIPRARAVCRGVELRLGIEMEQFGGQGECFLLGTTIEYFLSQWATMNSFASLAIDDVAGELRSMSWKPRIGRRAII